MPKVTTLHDETCFICVNSGDYLGVTRKTSDEWKVSLSR